MMKLQNFTLPAMTLSMYNASDPVSPPARHPHNKMWLLDSGAVTHVSSYKEAFPSFTGIMTINQLIRSATAQIDQAQIQLGGRPVTLHNVVFLSREPQVVEG